MKNVMTQKQKFQKLIDEYCFQIHEFKHRHDTEELNDYSIIDEITEFDKKMALLLYGEDASTYGYSIKSNRDREWTKNPNFIITTKLKDEVIIYQHGGFKYHMGYYIK